MEKDVFSYLEKDYGYLNNLIRDINEYLFTASHTSIVKGRVFAENLSKEVAKLENLDELNYLTQNDRLRELKYKTDIEEEALNIFHEIRRIGNIAAHADVEGDLEAALRIHKYVYKITCWFVQTYIDYTFESQQYKNPKPEINQVESSNFQVIEEFMSNIHNKIDTFMNISKEKAEINQDMIEKKVVKEIAVDNQIVKSIKIDNKECLVEELSKLKESSKEAVESLNNFSQFKKYMHIEREAQRELENIIRMADKQDKAQLILVCGSVGDGKSHIISYFKNEIPDVMENFILHNDATESLEPNKTSMDTLNEVLDEFSDDKIKNSKQKFILAINLGTLNNFIDSDYSERFKTLKKYVINKKILENGIVNNDFDGDSNIHFVNFSDYHLFTLKDGKVKSNYIKSIIKKITESSELNLFYKSYKTNCTNCVNKENCPIKANYELLSDEKVQDGIVDLLVQAMIKSKIIISTRALLNFMYELIIARSYIDVNSPIFKNKIGKLKNDEYIKSLTPNLIFEHRELSFIFESLNNIDPLNIRNEKIDDFILKFNNSTNFMEFFNEYIDFPKGYLNRIYDIKFNEDGEKKVKKELLKLFIRSYYLCGKKDLFSLKDDVYDKFMQNLYWWNKGEKSKLKDLYGEIKDGILKWNGEADKEYINIFIGQNQTKYKVSEEIGLKADVSNLSLVNDTNLKKFLTSMELKYKSEKFEKSSSIDIDFSLYNLLNKVNNGYRPNKKDKNNFIKFIEFINKIEGTGSQSEQLIFTEKNRENNKRFKLEYDDEFEIYKFMEI